MDGGGVDPRPFAERVLKGSFSGLLRWDRYDALIAKVLETPDAWHVYDVHDAPPPEPATEAALRALIDDWSERFARERARDSLGFVYVDDRERPTIVKVFDPMKMGGCGSGGGGAKVPRWVLSLDKPEPLVETHERPVHKPLFDRLMGR